MTTEQILQAKDENDVISDLGILNTQGNINLATHDEDANITLGQVLTALNAINTELQQKIEEGGTVSLSTASLNALESVSATISNLPSDYPDAAALTELQGILAALGGTLAVAVQGDVALDAPTVAALKAVTVSGTVTVNDGHPDPQTDALTNTELRATPVDVTISNPTADPETGLAKEATLQSLLTELQAKLEPGQQVALDTATLAALEDVNANVSGTVDVGNHPAEYPDTTQQGYLDNRYGGGKTAYAGVLNTTGDNVVITPALGNSITVYWVSFVPDSDNAGSNLVTVKIGSTPIYAGYAMAHWEIFQGAIDESVVVNLETNRDVAVTIHYKES